MPPLPRIPSLYQWWAPGGWAGVLHICRRTPACAFLSFPTSSPLHPLPPPPYQWWVASGRAGVLHIRGQATGLRNTFLLLPPLPSQFSSSYCVCTTSGGRPADGQEFSIFVGDLAPDVNDYLLCETFRCRYGSVRGAKVVVDNVSGRTKGYGFVRFSSEEERDRALHEMNGQMCSSRPMRISVATPKKPGAPGQGKGKRVGQDGVGWGRMG
ncbi:unnamed protein product [Closterium sp. NIES-54]